MTKGEQERLGILETKVDSIQEDISEIKVGVAGLVAAQALVALQLANRQAVEDSNAKRRAGISQWGRAVLPVMLSLLGGGFLFGFANFVLNALELGS